MNTVSYFLFFLITLLQSFTAFSTTEKELSDYSSQTSDELDLDESNQEQLFSELFDIAKSKLKDLFSDNKAAMELDDAIETLIKKVKSTTSKTELVSSLNALREKYDTTCLLYKSKCMDLIEILFFSKFSPYSTNNYLNLVQHITSTSIALNKRPVIDSLSEIKSVIGEIKPVDSISKITSFALTPKKQFTKSSQKTQNHILSDVDDTLFASSKGGTDKSHPNLVPYPGVISFHQLVSNSYSTLLSARPNLIEKSTREDELLKSIIPKLNVISSTRSIWDLSTGIEFLLSKVTDVDQVDYAGWAINKFVGFLYSYFLNPDKNLIFIGDNGQGDLYTALLIRAFFPQVPTLIHDIKPDGKKLYSESLDKNLLEAAKTLGVILFEDYADAARKLENQKSAQGPMLHINLPPNFAASLIN